MRFLERLFIAVRVWLKGTPAPSPAPEDEFGAWNRLVDQGWVERWHPRRRYQNRDWLWVRRDDRELMVYRGTQSTPRTGRGPVYRLNGNLAYRDIGHPEGPSSIPWLVIRGGRVYPGEGHPKSASGGAQYMVEQIRRKGGGVTIRPVSPRD